MAMVDASRVQSLLLVPVHRSAAFTRMTSIDYSRPWKKSVRQRQVGFETNFSSDGCLELVGAHSILPIRIVAFSLDTE